MNSRNGTNLPDCAVHVSDLRDYLLANGCWKIKPFKRKQAVYFEGPPDDDGNPLVLLVPASENQVDYPLRIEEILRGLSVVENRPIPEIVRSIMDSKPAASNAR